MARHTNYYHDENRKVQRTRPKGGVKSAVLWVADVAMFVVSIASALALLGGVLASVVSPQKISIFAFAGLFYQVVYLVNIGCALWWVVRWKRWFFLSATMLVVGLSNIGLFYRSDLMEDNETIEKSRDDLVVATYNVMNFSDKDSAEGVSNYHCVGEWLNEQGVQVACLQEAHFSSSKSFAEFRQGLRKMSYGFFTNAQVGNEELQEGSGYAIFSTYPIVRHSVVGQNEKNIYGVWADLKVGRDTLRIVNLHLQSTGITSDERRGTLSPQIIDDTMAREKLSKVVTKMVENYRQRAEQSECVAQIVEQSPYRVVVCGDFNDTPASYTYNQIISEGLADAYVERGRGTEYTFKGLYNLFRIDYVLPAEEHFNVKQYNSYDLEYSDHKAVVVTLAPKVE